MAFNSVNADNIRLVAKTIREHEKQFDLRNWVRHLDDETLANPSLTPSPLTDCGTLCCICGFANALAGTPDPGGVGIGYDNIPAAARFMGLPCSFARALFVPPIHYGKSIHACRPDPHDPWRQAVYCGLISAYDDILELPADTVAGVLEAIVDGRIGVCEVGRRITVIEQISDGDRYGGQ